MNRLAHPNLLVIGNMAQVEEYYMTFMVGWLICTVSILTVPACGITVIILEKLNHAHSH